MSDFGKEIKQRFYRLLIGPSQSKAAAAAKAEETSEEEATSSPDRELLDVEIVTKKNKHQQKKSDEAFRITVRETLHQKLDERLSAEISEFETVWNLARFDENITKLVDILHVRAASIGRLDPLVTELRWLKEDIIRLVNLPQYRRVGRDGKPQRVEGVRVALNYIGLENLKQVIPSFTLRRMIPQITDPYPTVKRQLWEHSLGTALAAKKIAEINEKDDSVAFIAGMFHDVGKMIVVRLYFKLFDQIQVELLKDAHDAKNIEEYDALRDIEPNEDFLIELLEKYAVGLTRQIVGNIHFQRINILDAVNEFHAQVPYKEMHPMAQILHQANAYSEFRMLKSADMISLAEAKKFIIENHISPQSLAGLKSLNLKKLNLVMD